LGVVKADLVISRHLGRVPVSGIGLGKVSQERNAVRFDHAKVDTHVVRLTSIDNLGDRKKEDKLRPYSHETF
jgi:hypothetical protein